MLLADCHMHSLFSTDSEAPMEEMVEAAAAKGLETICFTEHLDYDYPKQPGEEGPPDFLVDLPAYQKALFELKERYRGRVEVLFGLEMGVMPYLGSRCSDVARSFPFDFVLASSHLVDGRDPYYPSYFEGISEEEGYEAYFRTIPANLAAFPDFHSYAHLDYIVRYGPRRNEAYSFEKSREALVPALLQASVRLSAAVLPSSAVHPAAKKAITGAGLPNFADTAPLPACPAVYIHQSAV